MKKYLPFLLAGTYFGILLAKGEVISWFRIQEMFRFQSFHMYGIIGSAVVTGIISVQVLKATKARTFGGQPITFHKKAFHPGIVIGGLMFGIGWAFTGACPGPLYSQLGLGVTVVAITLLSAVVGTWVYGYFKERLPH
jgi:uncharacterized membrane protein YedE/YeeE